MTDFLSGELARDSELLERIANGDAIAHGLLFDAYAAVVFGYALRLTGDTDEATDLVSSVFRTVWQQPADARSAGLTVRAWLAALCRQLCAERPRQPRLVSGPSASKVGVSAREPREFVLPLLSAEDVQRRDQIQAALADLDELTSTAFELVCFDGLSIRDAAQRLGVPAQSARTLVSAAMQSLRHSLRPAAAP